MNILLINHYAGSPKMGMEYRPYYLSKEWVKLGHKVTILGADFSHLRIHQPLIKKDLQLENIDEISYLWLKTPKYSNSGLKRIKNMLTFVLKIFIYRNKIRKIAAPDVVIASSTYPLDIYPAYSISRRAKAKLVFELHDMWPLSPMLIGGYSKHHPFIWLMQQAENFACRNCDYYISLLSNTKQYLVKHGLEKEKFHYVPNGYSIDELNIESDILTNEHQTLITKLHNEGNLIVGYAGGHAPSNALKSIVFAAKGLGNHNKISFILVGNGIQKVELKQIAIDNNIKNIYFLPSIPKAQISSLLSQFDILYAGGTKSILHSHGTSFNKIIDYMLAEKPIIFAVDEPNSIVEKAGCGIQIPAENEYELIKTIKLLSEMSIEERIQMGKVGREYALKELNYTTLAKKFIEAMK